MTKEEEQLFEIWKDEQKAKVHGLEDDNELHGGLKDIFIDRAIEPFGTWKAALLRNGKLQGVTETSGNRKPLESKGSDQQTSELARVKQEAEIKAAAKAAEIRAAVKKVFADLNTEAKKKAWGLKLDKPTLEWASENEIVVGQHLNNHFSEAAQLLGHAGARWNQETGAFVVVA